MELQQVARSILSEMTEEVNYYRLKAGSLESD